MDCACPSRLSNMRSRLGQGFSHGLFEPVEVDGFREMSRETGSQTLFYIVLHAEAAESDPGQTELLVQLRHEVVAGTIGQPDIAHEQVEFGLLRSIKRGSHAIRGGDFI